MIADILGTAVYEKKKYKNPRQQSEIGDGSENNIHDVLGISVATVDFHFCIIVLITIGVILPVLL